MRSWIWCVHMLIRQVLGVVRGVVVMVRARARARAEGMVSAHAN